MMMKSQRMTNTTTGHDNESTRTAPLHIIIIITAISTSKVSAFAFVLYNLRKEERKEKRREKTRQEQRAEYTAERRK